MWGDMWIETDVKECCHGHIESAMWIWKDVTGISHDKYEVLFELEPMN
jgi:hypothetical protein